MRISFVLLLLCFNLAGCATMFEDLKIAEAEKQNKFYIGMSKQQVIRVIGRGPDCVVYDRCYTENTSDGVYNVWVVNGGSMGGSFSRVYNFKFKNEELVSWGWH